MKNFSNVCAFQWQEARQLAIYKPGRGVKYETRTTLTQQSMSLLPRGLCCIYVKTRIGKRNKD